jgi:3',5'-cyclic-AMP phosphodiesterase
MAYLIAQISDTHIGGPQNGSDERLSMAIHEINTMTRQPDLVLFTGDLTHNGTLEEWNQFGQCLAPLVAPWEAIAGNHDRNITDLTGNRAINAGPLRLVLLDTSNDTFSEADAAWLDHELHAHGETPTIIAIHQPPFVTGIWWMDCVGLKGSELLETVVRRHPQVLKILSGHVHRLIQSNWGSCSLWVCPSTSVSIAADLDPSHDPAETAEAPTFSLHAYVGKNVVSHLVPIGLPGTRTAIGDVAPEFITWARNVQSKRVTEFT